VYCPSWVPELSLEEQGLDSGGYSLGLLRSEIRDLVMGVGKRLAFRGKLVEFRLSDGMYAGEKSKEDIDATFIARHGSTRQLDFQDVDFSHRGCLHLLADDLGNEQGWLSLDDQYHLASCY
jgi:hypothetical protein